MRAALGANKKAAKTGPRRDAHHLCRPHLAHTCACSGSLLLRFIFTLPILREGGRASVCLMFFTAFHLGYRCRDLRTARKGAADNIGVKASGKQGSDRRGERVARIFPFSLQGVQPLQRKMTLLASLCDACATNILGNNSFMSKNPIHTQFDSRVH